MIILDELGKSTQDFLASLRRESPCEEELAFLSFAVRLAGRSKAQLMQDSWVLFELGETREAYFVEFGAADGLSFSNSFMLERSYGWKGALAEPCPAFAEALGCNRSCFISHKGVAPSAGRAMLTIAPDMHLSTFASFSSGDHLDEHRRGGSLVEVETQTLAAFLEEAGAPRRIDYLSIDTEGSEETILRTFDWGRHDIRAITVEHNYTPQREGIFQLLTSLGFERRFERLSLWDDWYIRR